MTKAGSVARRIFASHAFQPLNGGHKSDQVLKKSAFQLALGNLFCSPQFRVLIA